MEPTEAIKDLVREKVGKVKKYLQGPIDVHVVFSVERYLHTCDVTISANGHVYKGKEESDDLYTSIDKALDKIERQIDRTKGRRRAGRTSSA
jgi:putative sigma-54 modulation protein